MLVYVNGVRIIRSRSHKQKDKVAWNGKVHGKLLPPGPYLLTVDAVDLAGNKATDVQHVAVDLRYITLLPADTSVKPRAVFHVSVSTDAKRYHWSLAGRKGVATTARLKLRAPSARGRYRLTVTENGHSDHAAVTVR